MPLLKAIILQGGLPCKYLPEVLLSPLLPSLPPFLLYFFRTVLTTDRLYMVLDYFDVLHTPECKLHEGRDVSFSCLLQFQPQEDYLPPAGHLLKPCIINL